MKKTLLIISINIIIAVCATNVLAQANKNVKIDVNKTVKVDAKTLFDVNKIRTQLPISDAFRDLGVKGAVIAWNDYDKTSYKHDFELEVTPILTKNSKVSQIFVRDYKGEYVSAFKIRVEALDNNGNVIEKQEKDFIGWTVEDTEAKPFDFRFFGDICYKTATFRITADPDNLLKETDTENNVIVVKKTQFIRKEYSATVYPETNKP